MPACVHACVPACLRACLRASLCASKRAGMHARTRVWPKGAGVFLSGNDKPSQNFVVTNSSSMLCLIAHCVSELALTGGLSSHLSLYNTKHVNLTKKHQTGIRPNLFNACLHLVAFSGDDRIKAFKSLRILLYVSLTGDEIRIINSSASHNWRN